MDHCRTFANAADHELAIHAAEQGFEISIARRVITHDCILDPDANAVVYQSRHRVETAFLVRAKISFVLEIDNQLCVRGFGDFSIAALEARRVRWVAARQNHRARELKSAKKPRLVHCAPIRRPDTRNYPEMVAKAGEPLEQLFIFSQRDVVQERVAAINQSRNSAATDVAIN